MWRAYLNGEPSHAIAIPLSDIPPLPPNREPPDIILPPRTPPGQPEVDDPLPERLR